MSFRTALIHLAAANTDIRPHLLSILAAQPTRQELISLAEKMMVADMGPQDGKAWLKDPKRLRGSALLDYFVHTYGDNWWESAWKNRKTAALHEVAQTILDQMGGQRKVSVMLGVGRVPGSGFYALPRGLGFTWPNRQRSKGNCCEIELRGDDTYTVTFYNWTGADKKEVKSFSNIYADQLVSVFEKQTGWMLRL